MGKKQDFVGTKAYKMESIMDAPSPKSTNDYVKTKAYMPDVLPGRKPMPRSDTPMTQGRMKRTQGVVDAKPNSGMFNAENRIGAMPGSNENRRFKDMPRMAGKGKGPGISND